MKTGPISRRGAFTLVEILMVVVILGIAAAIIVPQIGTRGDLKAAAAARVVMADLIYAQNRSIAQQTTTFVKFSTTGNNYLLASSITPLTYIQNPVSMANYTASFGSGGVHGFEDVTLKTVTLNGSTSNLILAFDALGIPKVYDPTFGATVALTQTGTILIQSGQFSLTVTIQPDTGEIDVQ